MTMVIADKLVCRQCGYSWHPRILHPRCCPQCISRHWNEPKKKIVRRRRDLVPA